MTTTNQPSDAAKAIWAEAWHAWHTAPHDNDPATFVDKCCEAAALVIERHLTPSEPVAYLLEWPNAETGAPMRAVTISKPEVIAGESLTPLYATPPTPANSDAGLVERIDYILDPSVSASERMQRRSHLTNHDLRTIRAALSAIPTPAVNAELVEAISRGLICEVMEAGNLSLHIDFGKNREAARKVRDFLSRAEGERA